DDAYVGGMLHDMGKIIFSTVHPELLEKIRKFCQNKGVPSDTFEDMAGGMNHAEIGAKIAEKWNFPDTLIAAIRYHHEPNLESGDHRDLVYAVYLANVFCEYETGNITFEQIEGSVLADYGLTTEKNFRMVVEKMSDGFRRETSRTPLSASAKK
ncbi:MAG: HDOD domain-containing protein, partial [Spirochaetaceae bacterium]|nr:HDOD domain-containing protein [Spirochaetaceae bacterium]